ncbi:MAG: hypothetical protein EU529_01225 [Promethearchaeota archaeon]|nr:MAG: hypothetical protein EU529_01225 [Candidatus Lokiarchaeota archaeon]
MENNKSNPKEKKNWYKTFISLDFLILLFSIIIPLILIILNHQINGCHHHISRARRNNGLLWILGRSLGFTTLIWFIISSYQGFTTNKHAKLFHSKRKANDFHCIGALITNIMLGFHVLFLFISEPWRSVILTKDINHFPIILYRLKIWTGIVFAIAMIFVSILSFYLRDIKNLKKFRYKRFILIHRIMLLLTVILVVHIFLINTEIMIALDLIGDIDD